MPKSLRAMLIASPMPRVPPVTIATRAIDSLLLISRVRLGRGHPSFKLAEQEPLQHGHPFRRIVEAFEQRELLAPARKEGLAPADPELFQRLQAVGGEPGRGHRNAFDAAAPVGGERRIGRRFEPPGAAEARLESDIHLTPERLGQQPRGLEAMAVIGIAALERPLRHPVKAQQQALRLEIERSQLPPQIGGERLDVIRVVIIRWKRAQRGLQAHRGERRKHGVVRGRRRRSAILRIERRGEDARASRGGHVVDGLANAWIAVAHRIVDADSVAHPLAHGMNLAAGDDGERRSLVGPYLAIGLRRTARPGAEDDPVENRLPGERRDLDDPAIAEELGEVAADGAHFGRVGRPEVDEQNSDAALGNARMVARAGHATDIGSNGSVRILLPVPAKIALATAGASTVGARPLTPPGAALLGISWTEMSGVSPRRGSPSVPSARARGIPATHSASAIVACASAHMRPAATCCVTRPEFTARPQSTAATSRCALTRWSSPMVATATSAMCEPKAEQPAMPIVLPRPPPSHCASSAADWRQRARRGLPPSIDMRKASGSSPAACASSSTKLSMKKVSSRWGEPRM